MKSAAAFAAILLFVPAAASAEIVINEFLYDAEGTDTDKEFVELYNAGSSAVDLTKWKINDGSNHALNVPPKNGGTGSITIEPGGYAVLVHDAAGFIAAHPNVTGSIIDTVLGLSNTGTTIALIDDSGATVTSVSYTKDQGANGDGKSLQKSGTAWVAAVPTPLTANAGADSADTHDESAEEEEDTEAATTTPITQTSTSAPSYQSSYVAPPVPVLFADGGDDRTVIAGADTEFRGRAYNRKQDLVDNVRFSWNFGDGSVVEGQSVLHHFVYPGRYLVVLNIALDRAAVSDRITVTAEPAKLGFTVLPDSSVAIENFSGKNLDLSRWIIRSFNREFVFPEDTIILSGATVRIPQATIGFIVGPQTELQYPNGVTMVRAGERIGDAAVIPTQTFSSTQSPKPSAPVSAAKVQKKTAVSKPVSAVSQNPLQTDPVDEPVIAILTAEAQTAASGTASVDTYWWFAALGLGLLAGAGAIAAKRMQKKEWDIIEEA